MESTQCEPVRPALFHMRQPSSRSKAGPEVARPRAMRYASLFSGIGGFELGLGDAGHMAALLCEIWEPAIAVLEQRFPGVPLIRDVHEIGRDAHELPTDIDHRVRTWLDRQSRLPRYELLTAWGRVGIH